MSEYTEHANRFLRDHNIKFRATLSDSKPAPWVENGKSGHHYRVTLSKAASNIKDRKTDTWKPKRLVFDFWGSIADAEAGKTAVEPYDVLTCISSESTTPETFKDFCSEFGYDQDSNQDSIKAKQTFNRCSRFAKRLRAFFTAQELEQLQEIQ